MPRATVATLFVTGCLHQCQPYEAPLWIAVTGDAHKQHIWVAQTVRVTITHITSFWSDANTARSRWLGRNRFLRHSRRRRLRCWWEWLDLGCRFCRWQWFHFGFIQTHHNTFFFTALDNYVWHIRMHQRDWSEAFFLLDSLVTSGEYTLVNKWAFVVSLSCLRCVGGVCAETRENKNGVTKKYVFVI